MTHHAQFPLRYLSGGANNNNNNPINQHLHFSPRSELPWYLLAATTQQQGQHSNDATGATNMPHQQQQRQDPIYQHMFLSMTRQFVKILMNGVEEMRLDASVAILSNFQNYSANDANIRGKYASAAAANNNWYNNGTGNHDDGKNGGSSSSCTSIPQLQQQKKKIPRFNSYKFMEMLKGMISSLSGISSSNGRKCHKRKHSKIAVWCFGGDDAVVRCFPGKMMIEIATDTTRSRLRLQQWRRCLCVGTGGRNGGNHVDRRDTRSSCLESSSTASTEDEINNNSQSMASSLSGAGKKTKSTTSTPQQHLSRLMSQKIHHIVLIHSPKSQDSSKRHPKFAQKLKSYDRVMLPIREDTMVLMTGRQHHQRHFILPRNIVVLDGIHEDKLKDYASLFEVSIFDAEWSISMFDPTVESLSGMEDNDSNSTTNTEERASPTAALVAHLSEELYGSDSEYTYEIPQQEASSTETDASESKSGGLHLQVLKQKAFLLVPCKNMEMSYVVQSYSPLIAQDIKSQLIHEHSMENVEICEGLGGGSLEILLHHLLMKRARDAETSTQQQIIYEAFAEAILTIPRLLVDYSPCVSSVEEVLHEMKQSVTEENGVYSCLGFDISTGQLTRDSNHSLELNLTQRQELYRLVCETAVVALRSVHFVV